MMKLTRGPLSALPPQRPYSTRSIGTSPSNNTLQSSTTRSSARSLGRLQKSDSIFSDLRTFEQDAPISPDPQRTAQRTGPRSPQQRPSAQHSCHSPSEHFKPRPPTSQRSPQYHSTVLGIVTRDSSATQGLLSAP